MIDHLVCCMPPMLRHRPEVQTWQEPLCGLIVIVIISFYNAGSYAQGNNRWHTKTKPIYMSTCDEFLLNWLLYNIIITWRILKLLSSPQRTYCRLQSRGLAMKTDVSMTAWWRERWETWLTTEFSRVMEWVALAPTPRSSRMFSGILCSYFHQTDLDYMYIKDSIAYVRHSSQLVRTLTL